ncbi:hypothetical protein ACO0M4_32200 [Streptomyces sp. RGM 3693]
MTTCVPSRSLDRHGTPRVLRGRSRSEAAIEVVPAPPHTVAQLPRPCRW